MSTGFVHTTGFAPELLYPGLAEIWGLDYEQYPTKYNKVFKIESSDKAFEKEQGMSGFTVAGEKTQGDSVSFARLTQGFQKEYVHTTFGLGAIITREMQEDDQYNVISQIPTMLAEALRRTEETTHFAVLNNGFDAAITGADGVCLFSNAHPNAGSGGGTQSNIASVAIDLTQTALENAYIDIENFRDENNQRISMPEKKKLVVSRADMINSQKIIKTQYKVGSADNDVNILANSNIELIMSNYLTDQDAWFIINGVRNGLKSKVRREADIERDKDRVGTQNLAIVTTKRWSQGWTDWRDAYASSGAG
jgi:uncharacterized protein YbaR (Trm112 family)